MYFVICCQFLGFETVVNKLIAYLKCFLLKSVYEVGLHLGKIVQLRKHQHVNIALFIMAREGLGWKDFGAFWP